MKAPEPIKTPSPIFEEEKSDNISYKIQTPKPIILTSFDNGVSDGCSKQINPKIIKLNSTQNNEIEIKYYISEETIIFESTINNLIPKKIYKKIYSYTDILKNKFFVMCENIKEIYDEIQNQIDEKLNDLKLIEEENNIILIIPLNTKKIKEIIFEMDI